MVSRMTPAQMDELAAYDAIHPIGSEKVAWVVAMGFARVLNELGVEISPKDLIPWEIETQRKSSKVVSPSEAIAAVKAMFGN